MPVTPTYPGIYIQEAPSSAHTISPAPTNIAVFIGYTHPLKTAPDHFGKPVQIFGFTDYQRQFGGFLRSTAYAMAGASQWIGSDGTLQYASDTTAPETSFGDMAVAVNQFFINGGTEAYVVALLPSALSSLIPVGSPPGAGLLQVTTGTGNTVTEVTGASATLNGITFTALEITDENFAMKVTLRPVSSSATSPPLTELADVIITYGPASGEPLSGCVTETYRRVNLSTAPNDPNNIAARINGTSALVTVDVGAGASFPSTTTPLSFGSSLPSASAPDGLFAAHDFTTVMQENTPLDKLTVFNLLVIPGVSNSEVLSVAQALCERKMAFNIVDPPITDSVDGSTKGFTRTIGDTMADNNLDAHNVPIVIPSSKNAALYFPYLYSPDPITGLSTNLVTGAVNEIPPAATVAGVFASTDLSRGVWKAPAGFQATTGNVNGVVERGVMTDMQQGQLNPLGVNCLRQFPGITTPAVFGARTLVTQTDEQWRYVPVRRMALFLEQTFYANLKWVIFEPNADPLWSAITMSINAFMLGLFKQGAFQGVKPSDAFYVLCNSQTTTQADIDNGIVNIVVGFAPLKPAEFVVVTIAQMAGQTQSA